MKVSSKILFNLKQKFSMENLISKLFENLKKFKKFKHLKILKILNLIIQNFKNC